ncbi:uncharacterized protein LY89DRAFT_689209, partial [Mollisia scopiformis]
MPVSHLPAMLLSFTARAPLAQSCIRHDPASMSQIKKTVDGCWTCRIRRKRCNSRRPVCDNCHSLEIVCHFDEQKPKWMDNGDEQRKMMQTIKNETKQNALRRREKRNIRPQDQEMVITLEKEYLEVDVVDDVAGRDIPMLYAGNTEPLQAGMESVNIPGAGLDAHPKADTSVVHAPMQSPAIEIPSRSPGSMSLNLGREVELGSIMIYLDYVFPFLFPFYRPSLLETGRHWLLSLLCQNEVSFYTAASLSSYFFSIALQDGQRAMQESCRAIVWTQLMEQMDLAVEKIQQDISEVRNCGDQVSLVQSARMLGEIIQLLIVEVMVRRDVDWNVHLTPALSLFEGIFEFHGTLASQPNLKILLRRLHPPPFATEFPVDKPLPNTAGQSALLFFTAILLFVDIISSTALDQPPRLEASHRHLLSSSQTDETLLALEGFVGCQNWVFIAISDISALSSWKKNAKCTQTLSVIDLANRAEPISKALEMGLKDLFANAISMKSKNGIATRLASYYSQPTGGDGDSSIAAMTRIWAHAARLYLSVVISGWQPAFPDVQTSVEKILDLFEMIKSPGQLRSLSWPLCVAGCLALPFQEQAFRDIIQSMGELRVFGTVSQAQSIMEAVWRARGTFITESWDIAECLRILGSPALL